jgi:hypothetical protein
MGIGGFLGLNRAVREEESRHSWSANRQLYIEFQFSATSPMLEYGSSPGDGMGASEEVLAILKDCLIMRKIAYLAVLTLSIALTGLGQTGQHAVHRHKQRQVAADTPAPPAVPVDSTPKEPPSANVSINRVPTLSLSKDWMDGLALLLTAALAVIGWLVSEQLIGRLTIWKRRWQR